MSLTCLFQFFLVGVGNFLFFFCPCLSSHFFDNFCDDDEADDEADDEEFERGFLLGLDMGGNASCNGVATVGDCGDGEKIIIFI